MVVVVRLVGGLGNQMFQYAIGRRLALDRGDTLSLDTRRFQRDGYVRSYRLDRFRVAGRVASMFDKLRIGFPEERPRLYALQQRMEANKPYHRRRLLVEQQWFRFDPLVLAPEASGYLEGFWQSYRYFDSITPVLREEFRLRDEPGPSYLSRLRQIESTNAVAVHVRRGDYLQTADQEDGFFPLSSHYYAAAMQALRSKVDNPVFYVFSNDQSWAQQHLVGADVRFVDDFGPSEDYLDLSLMRACRHHIIANSSFSWWAAWLSEGDGKLVIGPKYWIRSLETPTDLMPSHWLRIDP